MTRAADIDAHKDESELHGAGRGLQRRLGRDAATRDKGAAGTGGTPRDSGDP